MKSEFDKHLKQKLDNASPEEAGYSLNGDKLWGKIEQKKKGKYIRFMPWMSHAAAVAAGLAIGVFFFTKQTNNTSVTDTKLAQQQPKPSITTVHDTVFIVKKEAVQGQERKSYQQKSNETFAAHKTTNNTNQVAKQQLQQQIQTTLKDEIQPQTNKTKAREQAPKATFVATVAKPLQLLYLSDMDNENAKPKSVKKSNFAFLKKYLKDDIQTENPETFSMLVGNTLFNAKP